MLIRIQIGRTQPLAGPAATKGSEPLRFDGWLELLRVLAELVAAVPSGGENADTVAEPCKEPSREMPALADGADEHHAGERAGRHGGGGRRAA